MRLSRFSLALWLGLASLGLGLSVPTAPDARTAQAIAVKPQRPGVVDTYILSFGLWGPESVFESEAKRAAEILAKQLGGEGRTLVRFNTKRRFGAKPEAVLQAVEQVGSVLDPEEDVLVLLLTSHGSPDGIGLLAGRDQHLITPDDLRNLLNKSRARHRVVIVSACYSGIFAEALADERTLVITAAASDRPSFGCEDGRTWTYFGDAFFNKALRTDRRLDTAFLRARDLVTAREKREGYEPSNPQIAGGAAVLERLRSR
jgi:Peptidase C13 family